MTSVPVLAGNLRRLLLTSVLVLDRLEIDPNTGQFKRNQESPLACELLVADECSMIDVPLANQLLNAVATDTAMIFVGNVDQLPSMGRGQVLGDLIESGAVTVIRLTEVFRQAATSRIVRSAHRIRQGLFPTLPGKGEPSDFYLVPADEPEQIAHTVVDLIKARLPAKFRVDPVPDIQVLCPINLGITGGVHPRFHGQLSHVIRDKRKH